MWLRAKVGFDARLHPIDGRSSTGDPLLAIA
jgi:hypothetical protein